jgi:hypothetical protein
MTTGDPTAIRIMIVVIVVVIVITVIMMRRVLCGQRHH